MDQIFTCPYCEFEVITKPPSAGSSIRCPYCKKQFEAGEPLVQAEPIAVPVPPPPAASGGVFMGMTSQESPKPKRQPEKERQGWQNPWLAFGRGSEIVWFGLATELIVGTVMTVVGAISTQSVTPRGENRLDYTVIAGVCLVVGILGSLVVAVGRTKQGAIPMESGVAFAARVPALLTWLQVFLQVGGAALFVLAGLSVTGTAYIPTVAVVLMVAGLIRLLAEVAVLVNIGLISGLMNSAPLRRRVAAVGVVLQTLGLCCLVALALYAIALTSSPVKGKTPNPEPWVFAVLTLLCTWVYGAMALSLHALAERVALAAWTPPTETG